jgi:hypothetical protein
MLAPPKTVTLTLRVHCSSWPRRCCCASPSTGSSAMWPMPASRRTSRCRSSRQRTLKGSRTAVLRAHFAHARLHRAVAVFHFLGRLARRAKSAVDRQIGLGSGQPAEGHEVMQAHVVRLHPIGPHHLQARRALVAIANTVAPVVGGDEVAAGPLEHLEALLFEEPDHPGVESLARCRRASARRSRSGMQPLPVPTISRRASAVSAAGVNLQRKFLVFALVRAAESWTD